MFSTLLLLCRGSMEALSADCWRWLRATLSFRARRARSDRQGCGGQCPDGSLCAIATQGKPVTPWTDRAAATFNGEKRAAAVI